MSKIAANVKRLRARRQLTQHELAKKARVALVTVGRIEAEMQKNPDLLTLKKLAKALGVQVTELLD